MTLSLNEVEVLAKKATRGAGYPWGLAEEAGKATRWLCQHGTDGCMELAGLLSRCDGTDLTQRMPGTGKVWSASGGELCPIAAGAALSDNAGTLADRDLTLENVAHPMLLAPFTGMSARHLDTTVSLSWDDAIVVTDGKSLGITGDVGARTATVTVRTGPDLANPQTGHTRADPAPGTFDILNSFAHRTYAPATEESRLKGAGAGLSDND